MVAELKDRCRSIERPGASYGNAQGDAIDYGIPLGASSLEVRSSDGGHLLGRWPSPWTVAISLDSTQQVDAGGTTKRALQAQELAAS